MDLLILGSSGAEVRELQEKLIKLGFLSSAVSGSFDATTESAVKDFQTQRPWLLTDGVVGPMTLGEIDDTISVLDGQATLKAFAAGSASLDMASLRENALLSLAIQRRLRGLGLYPGGKLIDGDFGPKSQAALKHLCDETDLVTIPFQLTPEIADKLWHRHRRLAMSQKNWGKFRMIFLKRLARLRRNKVSWDFWIWEHSSLLSRKTSIGGENS
jgi:peptidoglycan hydrolase-like protein with peptidoglycan-binding domain